MHSYFSMHYYYKLKFKLKTNIHVFSKQINGRCNIFDRWYCSLIENILWASNIIFRVVNLLNLIYFELYTYLKLQNPSTHEISVTWIAKKQLGQVWVSSIQYYRSRVLDVAIVSLPCKFEANKIISRDTNIRHIETLRKFVPTLNTNVPIKSLYYLYRIRMCFNTMRT